MDLIILKICDCYDTKMLKSYKRIRKIVYSGIKDFKYTKEFITFVDYGNTSETIIETEKVIEFNIE